MTDADVKEYRFERDGTGKMGEIGDVFWCMTHEGLEVDQRPGAEALAQVPEPRLGRLSSGQQGKHRCLTVRNRRRVKARAPRFREGFAPRLALPGVQGEKNHRHAQRSVKARARARKTGLRR